MDIKRSPEHCIAHVILSSSVILLLITAFVMDARPRTDDAFLLADIANLAPEVSGRIISLNIHNNQDVHAGDVLFVIDPQPYQLKLDAAKAQSALASSTLTRTQPLLGNGYVTAEQIDQQR